MQKDCQSRKGPRRNLSVDHLGYRHSQPLLNRPIGHWNEVCAANVHQVTHQSRQGHKLTKSNNEPIFQRGSSLSSSRSTSGGKNQYANRSRDTPEKPQVMFDQVHQSANQVVSMEN
jgi:hypothetical protein